jgi:hypothetical protein
VHNDRVSGRRLGIALAAVVLTVTACSGGSSSTPSIGPTGSSSPTTTSPATTPPTTLPPTSSPPTSSTTSKPPTSHHTIAVVEGVHLTPEGTRLRLGAGARVSWKPNQRTTGVIRLAVTRLQQVRLKAFRDFVLDAATRRSTPYFVHATVTNLGRTDLSHVAVPLYLLDRHRTLIQASTFRSRFQACPSRALPSKFVHGKRAKVCLVYFAPRHGRLRAMSFRPSQDFSAITWRGHVHPPPTQH